MVFLFAPRYWFIAFLIIFLIVVGLILGDACQEANEDNPTDVEGEAAVPWVPRSTTPGWLSAEKLVSVTADDASPVLTTSTDARRF